MRGNVATSLSESQPLDDLSAGDADTRRSVLGRAAALLGCRDQRFAQAGFRAAGGRGGNLPEGAAGGELGAQLGGGEAEVGGGGRDRPAMDVRALVGVVPATRVGGAGGGERDGGAAREDRYERNEQGEPPFAEPGHDMTLPDGP